MSDGPTRPGRLQRPPALDDRVEFQIPPAGSRQECRQALAPSFRVLRLRLHAQHRFISLDHSGTVFRMRIRTIENRLFNRISRSRRFHQETVDKNEEVRLLLEMFPDISPAEAVHCLSLSNGSVDEAVQLVLHRQEIGESITNCSEVN